MKTFVNLLLLVILLACSNEEPATELSECEILNVSYSADIIPILETNCSFPACHDMGSNYGDFSLYEGIKEKAESGILWIRIGIAKTMPPAPSDDLDEESLRIIKCWLEDGAPNN